MTPESLSNHRRNYMIVASASQLQDRIAHAKSTVSASSTRCPVGKKSSVQGKLEAVARRLDGILGIGCALLPWGKRRLHPLEHILGDPVVPGGPVRPQEPDSRFIFRGVVLRHPGLGRYLASTGEVPFSEEVRYIRGVGE